MKKSICFFIHTEYHLLLSIHAIMSKYSDTDSYDIHLLLKRTSKSNRLKQDLELSFLPFNVRFLDFDLDLTKKLSSIEKQNLEDVLQMEFSEFNFFQEQDPITIIILNHYKNKGTKINLYQDGLKPYITHSMSFSPSLWINNIKQNLWIRKNGYPVSDYFSFINSKMYGFLKGINKLYLTFPEAYKNWNNLDLETITPEFTPEFVAILKQIFMWDDNLLTDRNRVIFFMNQPMHDDGSFEVFVLKYLEKKYPEATIYIKNHPLTSQVKLKAYTSLKKVKIIDSKIPAEIFISQLNDSIIVSVISTSMFINNPSCKFYYTFAIEENNNIERLKKYTAINPCKHVISSKNIDAIEF